MRSYKKGAIQYLSEEELKEFFCQIEKEIEQRPSEILPKRNLAIFKTIFFHALRSIELVRMKMSDFDFENNRIFIIGAKKGKQGREVLDPRIKKLILGYRQLLKPENSQKDILFISEKGGVLSTKAIWEAFQKYAILANLPAHKRHPHTLRHTFAMKCANKGKMKIEEVQALLRHKSRKTTEVYFQILEERKLEFQEEVFGFL